jgi:hypothetical protein
VTNAEPLTEYHQLHYDDFVVVHTDSSQPEFQLLVYPDGQGSGIGNNGSSLTSVYTGSPVASFKPSNAIFGCFIIDDSAVAVGVHCIVQVTAYKRDGSQYSKKAPCEYSGIAEAQTCTFPTTWTQVAKLSFTVFVNVLLTAEGEIVPDLLGSLDPGVGRVAYYFDDFNSVYTCVPGKSVSLASGLCV